jgi:hypothetical protein
MPVIIMEVCSILIIHHFLTTVKNSLILYGYAF